MNNPQNLDRTEMDKFASLAADWWNTNGRNKVLHDINPTRLSYISKAHNLDGASVLDVGCGGGILSEAMAKSGAIVTAIDPVSELIDIATEHARSSSLSIDYRNMTTKELAQTNSTFDLVTCMELIEHVPDPAALIEDCKSLLKPGGTLILATLDRTLLSYILSIFIAEYVLNILERGTHDYEKFLRPAELVAIARSQNLVANDVSGMLYNPLTRTAKLTKDPKVNYLCEFIREE